MSNSNILPLVFVAFAFISQALLIFNFVTLKWKPAIQQKYGWIVYAAGLIAFLLGILFWVNKQAWYFWLAFALFTTWALFGYIIDILRPVNWREPIRWQIFIPYVILYISAQFAFWIPLWFIGLEYWIIYAVLYTINTALNISTHFRPKKITSH
jgi:hypothetical protein